MRDFIPAVFCALAACIALPAQAQTPPSEAGQDTSGTDPTKLSRSMSFVNDYKFLTNNSYSNATSFRFSEPIADGRMALRANVPYTVTNAKDAVINGLGDVSLKWTWVAYLDRRQGFVVSNEVTAPTAADKILGTGRWSVSPGATYAYFLTSEIIIAPALIHTLSFGYDRDRKEISRTDFDFYTVYKPKGQNWWLTSDVTVSRDHIAKTTPMSWKLALGTNLGRLPGGGAVNLSIRPGVGFGPDRPFKWSLEGSIAVVGF
jgi:hypothetical protein